MEELRAVRDAASSERQPHMAARLHTSCMLYATSAEMAARHILLDQAVGQMYDQGVHGDCILATGKRVIYLGSLLGWPSISNGG